MFQIKRLLLNFSLNPLFIKKNYSKNYKLIIVGAGSAGLTLASKFAKILKKNEFAIIENQDIHYYQPLFTLVGGGVKKLSDTCKPMNKLIPKEAQWIKSKVVKYDPNKCHLILENGEKVNYEFLIVATGIELDFKSIIGLESAINTDGVCSNYSPKTVEKTWKYLKNFNGGNAIFTLPNTPIKCAGAPQKIVYLAEDYFRKKNIRDKSNLIFNSSLDKIFAVSKYAQALNKILTKKDIQVNFKHNLIEINSDKKEAIFLNLNTNEKKIQKYDFLHVTPPQKPSDFLKPLADQTGFVNVDKFTLQHKQYPNIFSLGDCSNIPTSKTAAAVAVQSCILYKNLYNIMNKKKPTLYYDGYTSCPLITSYGKCILAEFDFELKPKETFPFDQSKERRLMYFLKKEILPFIYWNFMIKGNWNGPTNFRNLMSKFKLF